MPRGVPRNRVAPASNSETTPVVQPPVAGQAVVEPDSTIVAPAPHATPAAAPELTSEQRMIKELQNQLALARGRNDGEIEYDVLAQPGSADNIIIHVVEDGFTALGRVWYRGQELEFEVGSQAYRDTFDRTGRSWLMNANNPDAKFRLGPWSGKRLTEAKVSFQPVKGENGAVLPAPTAEELARAEAAELKRRGAAPKLQPIS